MTFHKVHLLPFVFALNVFACGVDSITGIS